ncbi:hypothetical protein R1flu_016551 [Riccia fluitans]|uniref:Uncharacterized protein n=1 Tax=Riccia fluitans TaxID=41844 RepID=A0ABD1YMC3_9MARC
MRMSTCYKSLDEGCYNPDLAYNLKLIAVVAVFLTGSVGVALPLVGRSLKFLRIDGNFFAVTKAFAAGVILSTGFVHILPDAQKALSDPCLSKWPWSQFPFAGFVAMFAALLTLLTETLGTEFYASQHSHRHGHIEDYDRVSEPAATVKPRGICEPLLQDNSKKLVLGDPVHPGVYEGSTRSSCQGGNEENGVFAHSNGEVIIHGGQPAVEKSDSQIRQIVISQVLEVAVIAHSFIIGLSLGVSENPCAIKPLLIALSFHQLFEGFALGGCFSQAGFVGLNAFTRAGAFSVTTPVGIITGILLASSYRANTARAMVVEGLFDAASAGILIYMALVDLIAAEFLSDRQVVSLLERRAPLRQVAICSDCLPLANMYDLGGYDKLTPRTTGIVAVGLAFDDDIPIPHSFFVEDFKIIITWRRGLNNRRGFHGYSTRRRKGRLFFMVALMKLVRAVLPADTGRIRTIRQLRLRQQLMLQTLHRPT